MTAREHLERSADLALEYFDAGDHSGAITCFISETGKHYGTEHIPKGELTMFFLEMGYQRGRRQFQAAMLGFAVNETSPV